MFNQYIVCSVNTLHVQSIHFMFSQIHFMFDHIHVMFSQSSVCNDNIQVINMKFLPVDQKFITIALLIWDYRYWVYTGLLLLSVHGTTCTFYSVYPVHGKPCTSLRRLAGCRTNTSPRLTRSHVCQSNAYLVQTQTLPRRAYVTLQRTVTVEASPWYRVGNGHVDVEWHEHSFNHLLTYTTDRTYVTTCKFPNRHARADTYMYGQQRWPQSCCITQSTRGNHKRNNVLLLLLLPLFW